MIYTITASYGDYEDRCDIKLYITADLGDCQRVMRELWHKFIAEFDTLAANDVMVNRDDIISRIAYDAHFEGRVHLTISSMELGVVSVPTFIESVCIESTLELMYNRDIVIGDELHILSKYEILALPYEAKYYGYRHW